MLLLAAGVGIPVALALIEASKDFVLARNLIPALVPLLAAIGIAVSSPASRKLGAAVGTLLFAYSLGFCVLASTDEEFQRPNWSAVAEHIGDPHGPRATVTWTLGEAPLRYYLSTGAIQVHAHERYDWLVKEIDFVSDGVQPAPPRRLLGPGFQQVGRRRHRPPLHPPLPLPAARAGAAAAAPTARGAARFPQQRGASGRRRAGVTWPALRDFPGRSARPRCPAANRGYILVKNCETERGRGMAKSKTTQTADRAGDLYGAARENPYVQRLIEDEDLRDNLKDAYNSAKKAYGRATGNGKGTVKAVTSDKKVQKEMRQAAEALQEARERLQKPKKKHHRLGKLILLAIIGGVVALVVSEGARKTVLDALFGAEEEFEYTSTTSINGS